MNRQQEMSCIQEVLNGNIRAFSKLVDAYKDYVFTLTLRMVTNREIAEEVAQDTFIKVFNSLETFKAESKFTTWLYRIAYNTSLDYLKKNKIYFEDIDTATNIVSDFDNGLDLLIEEEQSQNIRVLVNSLPKIDAMILSLYYFDEKSLREIEEILDLKVNNIKQRLYRSRKALAEKMNTSHITIGANE